MSERKKAVDQLIKDRLYTIIELSEMLGVNKQTIRRAIKRREIQIVKIGRPIKIPAKEIRRLTGSDDTVFINTEEASQILGITERGIRNMIITNKIKAIQFGIKGRCRIPKSEIERLVKTS